MLRHRSCVLPSHTAGKNQCGKPQQLKHSHPLPCLSRKSQSPENNSSREIGFLHPHQGWLQLIPLPFTARPQLGVCSANQPTWPCWLAPQGRVLVCGGHSCHCLVRAHPRPPLSVPDTSLTSRPCAKASPSSLCSSLLRVHLTFQRLPHCPSPPSTPPHFHRFIQTWYSCIST